MLTVVLQEIWHHIKTLSRHIVLKTDLYRIRITVGPRWFSAQSGLLHRTNNFI